MSKPALDATVLAQFTGSEHFFRHPLVRDVIYTEGIRYVAETAEAYWLIDEIVLAYRSQANLRHEEFQKWELSVSADLSATLICDDGNGCRLYVRVIDRTDFSASGVSFYLCDNTLLLPSEY
jgi:hypothetical protein